MIESGVRFRTLTSYRYSLVKVSWFFSVTMTFVFPEKSTRWSNDSADAVVDPVVRTALNSTIRMRLGFATGTSAM
jgi:hypothetical protein